jgi:hypothetical protein
MVREVQALAITEGLSLRDVENLFEWDIYPISNQEKMALETYVETAANRYADSNSDDSYYKEVAQTYAQVLAEPGGDLNRAMWQVSELHQLVFIGLRSGGHMLQYNPVLVPSAEYEGKGRRNYNQDDLIQEMAHDLGNIPHYEAYVKLIEQEGSRQVTKRHVVETPLHEKEIVFNHATYDEDEEKETKTRIQTYHNAAAGNSTWPRMRIDEEIQKRRTAWREADRPSPRQRHQGDGEPLDDPPPPHT